MRSPQASLVCRRRTEWRREEAEEEAPLLSHTCQRLRATQPACAAKTADTRPAIEGLISLPRGPQTSVQAPPSQGLRRSMSTREERKRITEPKVLAQESCQHNECLFPL